MRIIIIGAGRVGCGALGMALALQGHELVFAARRQETIDSINRFGYDVATKGRIEAHLDVRGVRAVEFGGAEFYREVATAHQIYTSVRPDNLPDIATILSSAILDRVKSGVTAPLDVFCCENLKNAGSQLERLIFTSIPYAFAKEVESRVGFNAAISDRIVSGQDMQPSGRLLFTADATGDVLVDTLHIKGDFEMLPPFKGLDNFPACIEEKLFVLNCGHAVCAYLGYRRGYRYIHEAMADDAINRSVVGAMLEAQQALQLKYGRTLHYAGFINEILESFSNRDLMDPISRVGRDPIRKLQPDDRLIGPAKLAYRHGLDCPNLITGCAAALSFSNPEDPQAKELQTLVATGGIDQALDSVSQLRPWNPLTQLIVSQIAEASESLKTKF